MKFGQLIGLGILVAPVAATGVAQAQTTPAPKPAAASEGGSYISVAIGRISDADYSYTVEELFPVEADVGEGYIIDAAYGMYFGDDWRGEVGFSWQDRNNANASWQFGTETGPGMSAYTLDAIGYRDFRFNSRSNFYVGAGVGVGTVTIDDGVVQDSTGTGLHLQAIAGVEARLTSSLRVFTEARVRQMRPSVEAGQAGSSGRTDGFDITSTSISAGVKFRM
ncbi:MAG: outer membrane beta-barrel protein [Archangium sp.]|nr:outer membrane beta-barrel protein [Archangium sp.]